MLYTFTLFFLISRYMFWIAATLAVTFGAGSWFFFTKVLSTPLPRGCYGCSDNLLAGFQTALTFKNIYLCFIGCLWGTVVGILPGMDPWQGSLSSSRPPSDGRNRRDHHAGRDLLRGHVRRLDHLHSHEIPESRPRWYRAWKATR